MYYQCTGVELVLWAQLGKTLFLTPFPKDRGHGLDRATFWSGRSCSMGHSSPPVGEEKGVPMPAEAEGEGGRQQSREGCRRISSSAGEGREGMHQV